MWRECFFEILLKFNLRILCELDSKLFKQLTFWSVVSKVLDARTVRIFVMKDFVMLQLSVFKISFSCFFVVDVFLSIFKCFTQKVASTSPTLYDCSIPFFKATISWLLRVIFTKVSAIVNFRPTVSYFVALAIEIARQISQHLTLMYTRQTMALSLLYLSNDSFKIFPLFVAAV